MNPAQESAEAMLAPVVSYIDRHVSVYNRPRERREMDLIDDVRQLLLQSVGRDVVEQAFDQNRFIQEGRMRNAHAQQYCLNRYFSLQFMTLAPEHIDDSQMARFSLLTDAHPLDWLTVFRQKVLPTLIHYRLPVVV